MANVIATQGIAMTKTRLISVEEVITGYAVGRATEMGKKIALLNTCDSSAIRAERRKVKHM